MAKMKEIVGPSEARLSAATRKTPNRSRRWKGLWYSTLIFYSDRSSQASWSVIEMIRPSRKDEEPHPYIQYIRVL